MARKPSELLGLVAGPDPLGPRETWARYGALCREHSTELVRPALLAALVQVESAGDPRARTYWRWRWSWNPFQLYAPASSAVGILQITDGTFEEARTLCIHRHAVVRAGAWYAPHACWFNALYLRTSAGDSLEMTAARLHVVTAEALAAAGRRPSAEQVDALAAVIHLCGRARGRAFAARGFRPLPGERCGDHDLGGYLARMRGLVALFTREAGG